MNIWNWIKSIFTKQNIKKLSKDERVLLLEENGYRVWTNLIIDKKTCGDDSIVSTKKVRINNSTNGDLGIISKLELEESPLSPNYSTLVYKIDEHDYYVFFNIEFNKEKDIHIIETIVEFIGCILEKYTLSEVNVKKLFFIKTSPKDYHIRTFTRLKLSIDYKKELIIIEFYLKEPKKITFKELDNLGPREAYIKALHELNRYNMVYDL